MGETKDVSQTQEKTRAGVRKPWEPPRMTWIEESAIRSALGQSSVPPGEFDVMDPQCASSGGRRTAPGEFDAGDPQCAAP